MKQNKYKIYSLILLVLLFLPLCDDNNGSSDDSYIIKELIQSGAKVFDVRTPEEYAEGHYEGAINIPLNEVLSRIGEFGPKDEPIIVYCRSGRRAQEAKEILEENGYTYVINAGGLEDMP